MVTALQAEITELQEVVAEVENERDGDIATLTAERDDLLERVKTAAAENADLHAQIRKLEIANAELTGRLSALSAEQHLRHGQPAQSNDAPS